MTTAVCPGSFDPLTYGHLDIITRAAAMFDGVTVGVLVNAGKRSLFDVAERVEMLESAVLHLSNVTVASFDGLLVDFSRSRGSTVIVKGLRASADFDYEVQMAQMNRHLEPDLDTVFLPASPERSFLASSLVKEVAALGGDVSAMLPRVIVDRLLARLADRGRD